MENKGRRPRYGQCNAEHPPRADKVILQQLAPKLLFGEHPNLQCIVQKPEAEDQ